MAIKSTYTGWQEAIRQIASAWNSNFNGTDRLTRGVDSIDDVILDSTTKGLVLKSANGHYWRASISNLGVVTWTDLGTAKP